MADSGLRKVLVGFKDFISRGNIVDLAVAFVIGMAFSAVVTALVADIILPLVGAIFGTYNFSADSIVIHHSHILYGSFIDAVVAFLSLAAGVYFLVVLPINSMQARRARGVEDPESTTRACPECLSDIPKLARRCSYCTAEVGVA